MNKVKNMPTKHTLYSYRILYDDGAAPNPYWGTCTLVICKPKIRKSAQVGDWIVATGSSHSPIGDISNKVVYAMCISNKMTMKQYDKFTLSNLPEKIPDRQNYDVRRRLGDSIYDFSTNPPTIRKGVHKKGNRKRDLCGKYALLSDHFLYFGNNPISLPGTLKGIIPKGQAHKSKANAPYFGSFVNWIHSLSYPINTLLGKPQLDYFANSAVKNTCSHGRCNEA